MSVSGFLYQEPLGPLVQDHCMRISSIKQSTARRGGPKVVKQTTWVDSPFLIDISHLGKQPWVKLPLKCATHIMPNMKASSFKRLRRSKSVNKSGSHQSLEEVQQLRIIAACPIQDGLIWHHQAQTKRLGASNQNFSRQMRYVESEEQINAACYCFDWAVSDLKWSETWNETFPLQQL